MERPPLLAPGAKPSVPRVRTVGFSVHGERDDEPLDAPGNGAYVEDSPLPVMIPPAFQVRSRRRALPAQAQSARLAGG